jgi:hypothetical protein
MVYNVHGAPDSVRGFGCELRGQEEAGRMLAEYVDEDFRLTQAGLTAVKENFMLPVCVDGVGCGKSALLSQGLSLHKKHCKNKDLLELLKDENHPLAIHITFNFRTSFSHQYETDVGMAVVRRILATCLGLDWAVANVLPVRESLRVEDCLRAIAAYHRSVHGMKEGQKLFVYLGIDEINMLVPYSNGESKPDLFSLKGVVRAVQSLSSPSEHVSTLLAGTHYADMQESFLGSGIRPLNLTLTRLSDEAIEAMLLKDAGVSQKYIDDPNFQELLRGIGPVMRPIGIAVSKLEYQYNEQSITKAHDAVRHYLEMCSATLSASETQSLFRFVLTGKLAGPKDAICEGSLITLDDLQNAGTISLIPYTYKTVSVFMSRLMLNLYLAGEHGSGYFADSARRLLRYIDAHGSDSFEKFAAHFHAMKKAAFLSESPVLFPVDGVPVASFFSGALIGNGLLKQELRLKHLSVPVSVPDGVMWWQGRRYPETAESKSVAGHLEKGGVVLNSEGAAAAVLVREDVRDANSSDWQEGITVFAAKHSTIGKEKLTLDDITADHNKAVKVLGASKKHSNALVTMVHFSNREISKELCDVSNWKPEWRRSIIVGRSNIETVVGPFFGRLLTGKGFCGIGGGTRGKSFSTLSIARPVAWMIRLFR